MTNEEAKVFLDNLKICINEHPVVADWFVEIANRKTEPTISKMEQVDEPERNMAEDIVESFGFKAESYRQAKAKDEPQIGEMMTEEEFDSMLARVLVSGQTDCAWK